MIFSGCISDRFSYVKKALKGGIAKNDHYKIFENRELTTGNRQAWLYSKQYGKVSIPANLEKKIRKTNPLAFLVIEDGKILYEQYWNNYNSETISNSFSIAKSIVSILIGIAIDEGKIKNIDQQVGDFIPQYRQTGKNNVTIRHLLTMTSGLDYSDSDINPFSLSSKAYYGGNSRDVVLSIDTDGSPGNRFKYQNFNTQILAFILAKATGTTLSDYAEKKLWRPIGAEHFALWSLDKKDGDELAWCCFNATARDFARLGQLYLNKGKWNEKQLISSEYVKESTKPSELANGNKNDEYGFMWWMTNYKGLRIFYAWGFKEQFIVIIPDRDIVFVRLANNLKIFNLNENLYLHIDAALALANHS